MHLSSYLGLLETGCGTLARSYRQVAEGHADEADVKRICLQSAGQCDHHQEQLRPEHAEAEHMLEEMTAMDPESPRI